MTVQCSTNAIKVTRNQETKEVMQKKKKNSQGQYMLRPMRLKVRARKTDECAEGETNEQ